jgi:phosphatidylglycerophosphate synthase
MDVLLPGAHVADRMRFSHLWNLAGLLTGLRLAIAVGVPWLEATPWLLPAYLAALLTDVLDGVVARRTGTASAAGAALDAWVDKILHVNLALTLAVAGRMAWAWLPVLFARECLQALMIPLLVHRFRTLRGPPPAASALGRAATIALAVTMGVLIAGIEAPALMVLTGVLSTASGLHYGWIHRPDRELARWLGWAPTPPS